jgi:hypothetical protein
MDLRIVAPSLVTVTPDSLPCDCKILSYTNHHYNNNNNKHNNNINMNNDHHNNNKNNNRSNIINDNSNNNNNKVLFVSLSLSSPASFSTSLLRVVFE